MGPAAMAGLADNADTHGSSGTRSGAAVSSTGPPTGKVPAFAHGSCPNLSCKCSCYRASLRRTSKLRPREAKSAKSFA
jgi:hypothetical protein